MDVCQMMACTGDVNISHCKVLDGVAVHQSESSVLQCYAE